MIGITSTMNGETTDNQKWPVDILLTSREVREQAKGLLEAAQLFMRREEFIRSG